MSHVAVTSFSRRWSVGFVRVAAAAALVDITVTFCDSVLLGLQLSDHF